METITISKEEYNKLRALENKIKKIDETIHDDITTYDLMALQDKSKSFDFLREKEEDIYSKEDVK